MDMGMGDDCVGVVANRIDATRGDTGWRCGRADAGVDELCAVEGNVTAAALDVNDKCKACGRISARRTTAGVISTSETDVDGYDHTGGDAVHAKEEAKQRDDASTEDQASVTS